MKSDASCSAFVTTRRPCIRPTSPAGRARHAVADSDLERHTPARPRRYGGCVDGTRPVAEGMRCPRRVLRVRSRASQKGPWGCGLSPSDVVAIPGKAAKRRPAALAGRRASSTRSNTSSEFEVHRPGRTSGMSAFRRLALTTSIHEEPTHFTAGLSNFSAILRNTCTSRVVNQPQLPTQRL